MKTWKEDNWFSKLRESFERYYAESSELSRLEEARTSNGFKTLKAENLAEFPKVFRDLFHLSSPELASVEDDTDLTQEVILPQRVTAVEAALKSIVKSAIVCRKDCEEIASVFVDNLVETVINLYLKTAEDCIEYRRLWTLDKLKDNLDYRRLKKQEKTIEARYPYGHPEKKEKELAKVRGDYASLLPSLSFTDSEDKKISTLPVDPADKDLYIAFAKRSLFSDKDIETAKRTIVAEAKVTNIGDDRVYAFKHSSGDSDYYRTALFDVRDREVCINVACNYIQKSRTLLDMKKVSKARKAYKCASFVEGLPNVKEGLTNSIVAEMNAYGEARVKEFQQNIYPLVAEKFKPLSEKEYNQLLSKAATGSHHIHAAYADAPAIETLRVATYTADQFKKIIGCNFGLRTDSQGNLVLVIKNDNGGIHSYADTTQYWNNLFRADILYLIDDPSRHYSNGSPAKKYLSVQVKDGRAFLGSGKIFPKLHQKLVKFYRKPDSATRDLCTQLLKALIRGDYLLVNDTTGEWSYLPHDPLIEYVGGRSTATEAYIYVDVNKVHRLKLRFAIPGTKENADDESTIRLEFRRASED